MWSLFIINCSVRMLAFLEGKKIEICEERDKKLTERVPS